MAEKVRPALIALAVVLLAACGRTDGGRADDLYTGKAFVTGKDERFRAGAIAEAYTAMLVKVTGDPAIAADPRVPALAVRAAVAVKSFSYRDRMEGLPIGDEQGTRDRPYDLTVVFQPRPVDDVLHTLGREPWTLPRPPLKVLLGVDNHGLSYVLTSDGEHGSDQRDSLADAAWGLGLSKTLPSAAEADAAHISATTLKDGADAAQAAGDTPALIGFMAFESGFTGWHVDWRLVWQGKVHHWTVRDVSYDEAFRNAMRGAAQILSGHGEPASS